MTSMPASWAFLMGSSQPVGSLQETPMASTPLAMTSSMTADCSAMSDLTEAV